MYAAFIPAITTKTMDIYLETDQSTLGTYTFLPEE